MRLFHSEQQQLEEAALALHKVVLIEVAVATQSQPYDTGIPSASTLLCLCLSSRLANFLRYLILYISMRATGI